MLSKKGMTTVENTIEFKILIPSVSLHGAKLHTKSCDLCGEIEKRKTTAVYFF